MTIHFMFDHIEDAEIEIVDIDEKQEEALLYTILGFCDRHFDVVKENEE